MISTREQRVLRQPLGWRRQLIQAGCGAYLALDLGGGFGGGIVQCGTARPLWLPYVEVDQIKRPPTTPASSAPGCCWRRARPAGWRGVISAPQCRRARALAAKTMTTGPERGTRAARAMLTASERELLEAAQRGDDDASADSPDPTAASCTPCYRMLGSAADAEDALQETLLRAWRGLPRFEAAARSAPGSTRSRPTPASGDRAAAPTRASGRLRARHRPHDGPAEPVTEAVWLEPYPDARLGLAATRPARRPAMSSARASSWPSSRPSSTCLRDSAPC